MRRRLRAPTYTGLTQQLSATAPINKESTSLQLIGKSDADAYGNNEAFDSGNSKAVYMYDVQI